MIQIIAGTFGYYDGRKVIPITHDDGPKEFDPELEARLVEQGIAEYIVVLDYSEDMKLDELKMVAGSYGVDASGMRKKSDVITAIEAAKKAAYGDPQKEDEPPTFDAAELV